MAPKLIVVCGPTAAGKTRLGVALAKALEGEVVSADSMQVYRGMAIGTAQPTREERDGVPHHMIAVADPRESYSAARYVREATACVEDILRRGKRPVVVGGTGLYIDALCRGLAFSAFTPETGTRARLQEKAAQAGSQAMWQELLRVDPDSARRLHPNDQKRILRALEVFYDTGKPLSRHNRETEAQAPRYEAVTLTLTCRDRQALYRRIDRRAAAMVEAGLVEEVQALLAAGVPRDSTAMQAIGYKELAGVLAAGGSLAQALAEIQLRSRQYAKRQLSWFRRNPRAHWLFWEEGQEFSALFQNATDFLRQEGVG